MPIYCKVKQKRTVRSFLKEGFTGNKNGFKSKFVSTYSDEECVILECDIARRSFQDLYTICSTRYKNLNKNLFSLELIQMIQRRELVCIYCPKIGKLVFIGNTKNEPDLTKNLARQVSMKSFDFKGLDNYSFQDIIDMANKIKKVC